MVIVVKDKKISLYKTCVNNCLKSALLRYTEPTLGTVAESLSIFGRTSYHIKCCSCIDFYQSIEIWGKNKKSLITNFPILSKSIKIKLNHFQCTELQSETIDYVNFMNKVLKLKKVLVDG